jgi:heptosyltransferase-2
MDQPGSLLVVLPTWVGDFVMATPTLRAIRNRFTKARIAFLMEPNLRDLVRGGDWMDECLEWAGGRNSHGATEPRSHGGTGENAETPKRRNLQDEGTEGQRDENQPRTYWELVKTLRLRRFDCAIVLPNSFRAALIARLSGAKRRIGYDRDGRGFLLTDRIPVKNRRGGRWSPQRTLRSLRTSDPSVPSYRSLPWKGAFVPSIQMGTKLPVRLGRYVPLPLVEYYADLAEAVGCERPGDRLELFTTPDCDESVSRRLESLEIADRHPLVVISPGAKFGASKCWLPERFAAVADHLIESEGATVIVPCGPGEESIARAIGAAMKQHGFPFDSPLLTLGELKSLIRRSDLLVCNDAGPRHIAKAFDVPVVAVFGPTHPDWTSTSYRDERIVRIDVDCGPCQQRVCPLGHHPCMTGVTVDMVFAAAVALLHLRTPEHARSR